MAESAASYEKRSGVQHAMGVKLMDMVALEKGSTVLDLGCGTGHLTKVLSERVGPEGKVVAVDPCLLYTSPSPRDATLSRMPSSA